MIAHGLLADGELAGDRGVALTARDELEDLALAFRQVWERLGRAGRLAREILDQAPGDGGAEDRLPEPTARIAARISPWLDPFTR